MNQARRLAFASTAVETASCRTLKNSAMNWIRYSLNHTMMQMFSAFCSSIASGSTTVWTNSGSRINHGLDKFRLALRFGPACGLIGTLVPMGTALASLGEGDLSIMTSELVMAYTTTVVGLALGCVSALLLTIRRRHAESDLLEMEYLAEKQASRTEAQS